MGKKLYCAIEISGEKKGKGVNPNKISGARILKVAWQCTQPIPVTPAMAQEPCVLALGFLLEHFGDIERQGLLHW